MQKQMISDLMNEMKDLPADERATLMQKMLDNPDLDPSVRAKLMEEMLKNVDDLSPEERRKLLEKMLENSDQLGNDLRQWIDGPRWELRSFRCQDQGEVDGESVDHDEWFARWRTTETPGENARKQRRSQSGHAYEAHGWNDQESQSNGASRTWKIPRR